MGAVHLETSVHALNLFGTEGNWQPGKPVWDLVLDVQGKHSTWPHLTDLKRSTALPPVLPAWWGRPWGQDVQGACWRVLCEDQPDQQHPSQPAGPTGQLGTHPNIRGTGGSCGEEALSAPVSEGKMRSFLHLLQVWYAVMVVYLYI